MRSDPFETADHEGMDYDRWRTEHIFLLGFGIDQVLEKLTQGADDYVTPR